MRTKLHHGKGLKLALIVLLGAMVLEACSSSGSITRSGNDRVDRVLTTAEDLQGTPYCSAGATPDCFDCSGFVVHCYAAIGIDLPRTSAEQYRTGTRVQDGLELGDLVFFNTNGRSVSHVGIYIGDGRFIHSATSSGVMISALSDRYWQPRYLGARRIVK